MSIFNSIINVIFDGLFAVAGLLGGEAALWIISAIAGVALLLIFKITSNQTAIRQTKDDIAASFLEVRLFKDDMRQMMSAQGRIFGAAFRYMLHALVPMLWMIVPVLLMLIQLNQWYGYRPMEVGQKAVVTARLDTDQRLGDYEQLELRGDDGVIVETPPLRIESLKQVNWRVKIESEGLHQLTLLVDGEEIKQPVHAGKGFTKITPVRVRGAWPELWNPGAETLQGEQPVHHFEITYAEAEANLLGIKMHWVIVFFILSIVFGFAFKGIFRVEI